MPDKPSIGTLILIMVAAPFIAIAVSYFASLFKMINIPEFATHSYALSLLYMFIMYLKRLFEDPLSLSLMIGAEIIIAAAAWRRG